MEHYIMYGHIQKTCWAYLLSSTMLFRSCAIFSSATFAGVELLFAIGSYKQTTNQTKEQIDKQKINTEWFLDSRGPKEEEALVC